MVTHWESSRRPLYVRTVWKDGQHHVILDKTQDIQQKELSTARRSKQSSGSQSSHRSTASAGVNLKVSSVRVLLSSIKGFKSTRRDNGLQEKSIERSKTWTQPTLNQTMTCKNLNKEVSFKTIQGYKAPSLNKSKTLDSERSEIYTLDKYDSNIMLDNALSEKVMVWLDLATNNYSKEDCMLTGQACNITTNVFNDTKVTDNIADSSILKNNSPRQEERKNEIIIYSNEETEMPGDNFYHLLTPRVDNEELIYKKEEHAEERDLKVNSVKRQLHIFMPNLPKKTSDCDSSSILSSKLSIN